RGGSRGFSKAMELARHDRRGAPGRGHPRSRSSAARAVERSARPRTLSLHAVAARPFHATEPAGDAALAVGLRSARRMVGKAAIAANATLLRCDACGVLAADGPGRMLFDCRRRHLSTDAESIVSYPALPNLGRVLINGCGPYVTDVGLGVADLARCLHCSLCSRNSLCRVQVSRGAKISRRRILC